MSFSQLSTALLNFSQLILILVSFILFILKKTQFRRDIMNRIKECRKKMQWRQEDLAERLCLDKTSVSKWENEKNLPNKNILEEMCNLFNVSMDYLLGRSDTANYFSFENFQNILPVSMNKTVPLVGTIACGAPTLAEENIEEYIKMDNSIHADFALRCKGDSMINARIFDGDIVYIRQQSDVDNGEIAAVLIDNEATLKKVYKYQNRIELRPENPTFPILNFEGDDLANIRILGKAVAFLSIVR